MITSLQQTVQKTNELRNAYIDHAFRVSRYMPMKISFTSVKVWISLPRFAQHPK